MDEKKIKALYSDFNIKIIVNCICGGSIYTYFSLDKSDSHYLHLSWIVIHPSLSLKQSKHNTYFPSAKVFSSYM